MLSTKIKKGSSRRPFSRTDCFLQRLYVLCLQALGSLDDVELNRLPFFQAAEAFVLNGGVVYEHVLAILPADETIPFGVIEPLHCSLFHGGAFLTVEFAELKQRRFEV